MIVNHWMMVRQGEGGSSTRVTMGVHRGGEDEEGVSMMVGICLIQFMNIDCVLLMMVYRG